MKRKFRDGHETGSVELITIETTRSKPETDKKRVSWGILLEQRATEV